LPAIFFPAVDDERFHALGFALRVLDLDAVGDAAEFARDREALPFLRNARIDAQAGEIRLDAEDRLAGDDERPGAGAGEPGVLAFAGVGENCEAVICA
jgi:hypothetical protein